MKDLIKKLLKILNKHKAVLVNDMAYLGTGDLKERGIIDNIDFTVYKNDVALVETDLNIQINASYPLDRTITIAHKTTGFDFAAGDKIQVKATSSSFIPLSNFGTLFLIIKNDITV